MIDSRCKFVGCKFGKSDRFYIFYISYLYGRFTLTYRKDINASEVMREKFNEENVVDVLKKVKLIVYESIINKTLEIISKNKNRSKNRKTKKYKDYFSLYKGIKLYELNVQPYVYNYFISENLVTVIDFLLHDFDFTDEDRLLVKKINYLKEFLLSSSKYSISNYKFLLKSSFKDTFKNEDYERYIEFALCVGNLTYSLVSKFFSERNAMIFL